MLIMRSCTQHGKPSFHINYCHSKVPEKSLRSPWEVPQESPRSPWGVPNGDLGKSSQGHPVVLRDSLKGSLRDFLGGLLRDSRTSDQTENIFSSFYMELLSLYCCHFNPHPDSVELELTLSNLPSVSLDLKNLSIFMPLVWTFIMLLGERMRWSLTVAECPPHPLPLNE